MPPAIAFPVFFSTMARSSRVTIDKQESRQSDDRYDAGDQPRSPIRSLGRGWTRAFWVWKLHRLAFPAAERPPPKGADPKRDGLPHRPRSKPRSSALVKRLSCGMVLWRRRTVAARVSQIERRRTVWRRGGRRGGTFPGMNRRAVVVRIFTYYPATAEKGETRDRLAGGEVGFDVSSPAGKRKIQHPILDTPS